MITKEIFNATEFKSHGIIYFNDKKHVYRVPAGWTPTQLPDDLKGRHSDLRKNVVEIIIEEHRCYEEKEKVLFSADAFGKFGALDSQDNWVDEARRYYFGIVGKYGNQVRNVLKAAKE